MVRFPRRSIFPIVASMILIPAALATGKRAAAGDSPGTRTDKERMVEETFTGLELRAIGPALTSGRITDIAVHPSRPEIFYVAAASGGVWKTTNGGTTFTPVFDDQGSYSIGCLAIDPNDPLTVWVGTGENNSQRSVGYGDGVYKSTDGGKTWTNVGPKDSEHIGKILIDPRDGDVVWVAAQGPLWRSGGDRGLYVTRDGGKTWTLALEISKDTGVTDIAFDPRDPDVIYAAAYQRRRRVWTLIDGGPESAIYKSTDGGKSWTKLKNGLPEVDMGRIGLAVSPKDPDIVYATIEAAGDASGFYRSTDAGGSWEKMSDVISTSPQYYQEIVADPWDADRVYMLDTFMKVSEDGGATWKRVGNRAKHVDDHALWIDPQNNRHLRAGCDGGLYESYDRGRTWHFFANLPITQFYRVTPDNDVPFYNLYGGTQDNATLGGPSRTTDGAGITNADWFVTIFGDGFKTQVDPEDPNIVYSQYQYGGLVRFDRRSGEWVDIQPQPEPGEALRWNWNSPLIVSPHSHTRLYFAANRVFRSDDRGQSWRAISGDLTRQLDRRKLEVMGGIQSIDAVARGKSTSFYGNVVALSESPLEEGLIYAGTDDGLIQVTDDGGAHWRRIDRFPGVPELSYVSDLEASRHSPDRVYAAFDNHKSGDFKPYLLVSDDRGRHWRSIAGDLPRRGTVYTVAEDHVRPGLLFAGTEFGLFFTVDGGKHWVRLAGGLPTIAIREIEIQRRENDLVLASFGRGLFVLDDYSPLRMVDRELLDREAVLFPVKDAWLYVERYRLGIPGKGFLGDDHFVAPNPPYGAVFTYYLADGYKTLEEQRHEREREARKAGEPIEIPSWDELRAEAREEKPQVLLIVRDAEGKVVRRITGPVTAGFHRVAWDLRYPAPDPTDLSPPKERAPWDTPPQGPLAPPGRYSVTLAKRVRSVLTEIAGPEEFEVKPLEQASLPAPDRRALAEFQKRAAALQRAVLGAERAIGEAETRLAHLMRALDDTPAAPDELARRARELRDRLADLKVELLGDEVVAEHAEPTPPGIRDRVRQVVSGAWSSTSAPTRTHEQNLELAREAFQRWLPRLRSLIETDLRRLEEDAEAAGAPWTPGRVPRWD
ncbi:MAG: glycosyl hydrolase [Acidobacteria bacterium]|nr:MAG: glycosyl hydrolase [Acidobacteriota bacterium]